MKISYSLILKEAWQIAVKNKILWLFGLFASFISLEAVYEVILGQLNQARNTEILHQEILNLGQNQNLFLNKYLEFFNLLPQDYSAYLFFIAVAIAVILFIWLIFISQIAIIFSSAQKYLRNNLKINEILSASNEKFWAVLSINILIKLFLYAGFLALSLPLLYSLLTQNQQALIAANLIFFVFYTIFAVIVSFLAAYATNFIVLKDLHILEAIKEAWHLFAKNITISLELAFVLFFLKVLSLIFICCLFFLAFVPLFAIFILALSNGSLVGIVMSLTLLILFFLVIALLINSIFTVFYLASWTITFIQLTENTLVGKISHFIKNLPTLFNKTAKKYNVEIDKKEIKKETDIIARQARKEAAVLAKKLEEKYTELKPKAKKQGKILAKKIEEAYTDLEPKVKKQLKKEAKILSKKLEEKYIELKPKAKKQSKLLAKKIEETYKKLEPKVEKKIKDIIIQKKKAKKVSNKKSNATKTKAKTRKTKTAKKVKK